MHRIVLSSNSASAGAISGATSVVLNSLSDISEPSLSYWRFGGSDHLFIDLENICRGQHNVLRSQFKNSIKEKVYSRFLLRNFRNSERRKCGSNVLDLITIRRHCQG